jgi:microcin C transport system substrate-binding protein
MKHHPSRFLKHLPALAVLAALVSGCGGSKEEETLAVIDNTEEVQEYYRTFKRVPLELKSQLAAGTVAQEDYNLAMEDVPLFFQFKTIADIPDGLNWENGMHLPDIGSPDAVK